MADSTPIVPDSLTVFIKYDRLTVRSLAEVIAGLASLAELAVHLYCQITGGRPVDLPALEIESAHTGESIKFSFGEGWLPSVSSNNDDDIVIDIPKKLGIPLLVGYLLLSGARNGLNVRNAYLDGRLKQIEIQLKQTELDEKLSRLRGAPDAPLLEKATTVVNSVRSNKDYTSFVIYDVDILNVQSDIGSQAERNREE